MQQLPIHEIINDIQTTLTQSNQLIVQAPPGAGKSTVVPISLLDELWLEDKIIIMLEPRRVAARMVATQMAKLLGEKVGQRVGYQIKMDNCTSKSTKIVVVTEAILVRKLQSNQSLDDVAMIIFDEFHERSIHTDLSLALSLQVQELLREDLKLLIMSATLNSGELLNLLGDVPIITSQGRSYDVENVYLNANVRQPDYKSMISAVTNTILYSIQNDDGDILVFLSGTKEIKTIQKLLTEKLGKKLKENTLHIYPLYSTLNKKEQDQAIQKSNHRKIILSTNIAQTSLTIEGVKVVIDSGLEKQSRYNYSNGMNHLELAFISQDSATQRAGRAGRLSQGKCYKLWHEKKILQPSTKPEILRSDLSSFILDITLWGVGDLDELKLLDVPGSDVIDSTKEVLQELQMLNSTYQITGFGKEAIGLGIHPRFAFMILKANELSYAYEACLLTTILNNKDILKDSYNSSDIRLRFFAVYEKYQQHTPIHTHSLKEILRQTDTLYSKLKGLRPIIKNKDVFEDELLGVLLLLAYPDRLAKQRANDDNRYKLSNGKGAVLNNEDDLYNEKFLVVSSLHAHNKESYIQLALPIRIDTIEEYFSTYLQENQSITYNKTKQKLDSKISTNFFKLQLSSHASSINNNDSKNTKKLLIDLIQKEGLDLLNLSNKAIEFKNRINFIYKQQTHNNIDSNFEDMSDKRLLESLDVWLEPYLENVTTIKQLQELDTYNMLLASIPWDKQQLLNDLLPTHFKVPSGSNIKIDYSNDEVAILAVKIQELFGLQESPKICNNTVALQIHLLSPAKRPIQITYDLKSFWDNAYDEVRKELRGKYKRHYWPENPYEAIATKKLKWQMN